MNEARGLIHSLIDGDPSEAEVRRLDELVCRYPAVCRLYLRSIQIHRTLPRYVAPEALIREAMERPLDVLSLAMILPTADGEEPVGDESMIGDHPPATALKWPVATRRVMKWAAAILIPIGLVFGLISQMTGHAAAPVVLASTLSAQWGQAPLVSVGQPLPDGTLQLQSGMAQLKTQSGVTIIVTGPAAFRQHSAAELELIKGTVTAMVPPSGRGFTVHTPTSSVVDLGTEFGVIVGDDGHTHVEVFKGTIQTAADHAGSVSAALTLHAGQAADVNKTDAAPVASRTQPAAFVRVDEFAARAQADATSSYGRWLEYSYRIRHDPALALYYPCDGAPGDTVLRNAALATAGQYDAASSPMSQGRWPSKAALAFDAVTANGRPVVDPFPITTNGTITITAWVNARSRPQWASIVKNRGGDANKTGQFSLGLRPDTGDLFGRVFPAQGNAVEVHLETNQAFPLNRWTHVALVVDGKTAKLFEDGKLRASANCGPIIPDPAIRTMAIGFVTGNDGHSPVTRSEKELWDGKIDELAIFHRPLSADEIRLMYEAGEPQ